MEPGDVVVLNDPFRGGTHLPDITLVVAGVPRRASTRPAFYVANRAHHSDVGGMSPGSMPLAREVYQEGLDHPADQAGAARRDRADVLALILANVRTPDEREGDLTAQIAANRVAEMRLRGASWPSTAPDRSTATPPRAGLHRTRAAADHRRHSATASIASRTSLDDDGFSARPITIRVGDPHRAATRRRSISPARDPQTDGGVNANFAITLSATLYAFRCLVRDDVLYNAGIARAVTVIAPDRQRSSTRSRPAAVAGGNVETSQRITDVVLGALARRCPIVIPAASQGTMNNVTLGGVDPRTGQTLRLLRDDRRRHGRPQRAWPASAVSTRT